MSGILYFDLETQKYAEDVGGWNNARDMRMSIGVTYSEGDGLYRVYEESDVQALIDHLTLAQIVIGYNIDSFDLEVLKGYGTVTNIRTFDLLRDIERLLGFRTSLENIAQATLGRGKVATGADAVQWFRAGEMFKLVEYCHQDVTITRDVHHYGMQHGHVWYRDAANGELRQIGVQWHLPPSETSSGE